MEDDHSRSAVSDSLEEDEEFDLNEDDGVDDEVTLDEEEALDNESGELDELRALEEEGEMSVEELRRMYGLPPTEDCSIAENGDEADEPSGSNTQGTSGGGGGVEIERKASSPTLLFGVNVDEDEDEQVDEDYKPLDPNRKEPRVDQNLYQCPVPECNRKEQVREYPATPLWIPTDRLDDQAINSFIVDCLTMKAATTSVPLAAADVQAQKTTGRDDEDCLFALLSSQYNTQKAKSSFPFPYANKAKKTSRSPYSQWDERDCARFEEGLKMYGKQFRLIQKTQLPHRHTGELIEFYYSWKKTERYDMFRQRHPQPDPHCTDYMEKVCDQMDERAGDSGKKWQAWEGEGGTVHA